MSSWISRRDSPPMNFYPPSPEAAANFEIGHVVEVPVRRRWWRPLTWFQRSRRYVCVKIDRVAGVIVLAPAEVVR